MSYYFQACDLGKEYAYAPDIDASGNHDILNLK